MRVQGGGVSQMGDGAIGRELPWWVLCRVTEPMQHKNHAINKLNRINVQTVVTRSVLLALTLLFLACEADREGFQPIQRIQQKTPLYRQPLSILPELILP